MSADKLCDKALPYTEKWGQQLVVQTPSLWRLRIVLPSGERVHTWEQGFFVDLIHVFRTDGNGNFYISPGWGSNNNPWHSTPQMAQIPPGTTRAVLREAMKQICAIFLRMDKALFHRNRKPPTTGDLYCAAAAELGRLLQTSEAHPDLRQVFDDGWKLMPARSYEADMPGAMTAQAPGQDTTTTAGAPAARRVPAVAPPKGKLAARASPRTGNKLVGAPPAAPPGGPLPAAATTPADAPAAATTAADAAPAAATAAHASGAAITVAGTPTTATTAVDAPAAATTAVDAPAAATTAAVNEPGGHARASKRPHPVTADGEEPAQSRRRVGAPQTVTVVVAPWWHPLASGASTVITLGLYAGLSWVLSNRG